MKLLFKLAFLLFSLSVLADEKPVDQTVLVRNEDTEMNDAIQLAQSTLDDFLKLYANPTKGTSGFKVKVKVTDSHGSEHMWVEPFKQNESGFIGTLANNPDYVRSVKLGQQLKFLRSDISDWGYVQDGKQKGIFTVCVAFKHMPKNEAQRYIDEYGFECKP